MFIFIMIFIFSFFTAFHEVIFHSFLHFLTFNLLKKLIICHVSNVSNFHDFQFMFFTQIIYNNIFLVVDYS